MQLNPHLNFNGQCAAAYKFYEQHLGAKTLITITYGASPMAGEFPPEYADKIMHATIQIGDSAVMGCDTPPGYCQRPNGFCVSLSFDDTVEGESVFNAPAENGKSEHAATTNFLGRTFRHADRSAWHSLDGKLQHGDGHQLMRATHWRKAPATQRRVVSGQPDRANSIHSHYAGAK